MARCAELSDKPQAALLLIVKGDPGCFLYTGILCISLSLSHLFHGVSSADMGKGLRNLQLTLQGFCMLDFNVQPCIVF